jgi:hypothetical protein
MKLDDIQPTAPPLTRTWHQLGWHVNTCTWVPGGTE